MLLEPVEVAGRKVDVAVTVGVAETEGDVAERLTDAALGAEAAAHDGTFWRRTTIDRGALERSVSLMGELDAAITAGEISVHYQPKLCLKTGHIASAEALVRWHHPARGYISPDIFIPLAEQADRIAPLTLHVLTTVLRDAASWRDMGHDVTAAINISAKLLSSSSFNSAVDRLLLDSPVPHAALIFEVTESATMPDPVMAVEALQRYRARGIAVSMDDYGTGQSTLTYLKRLPLNELKIDRSFVQHAHKRSEDALLVRSTIELAHQLGLKVVAEGIEDEANLVFLRAHGCDYAQGYFISKPVPYAAFLELLNRACGQTRLRAAG
jgi:EAL domain-containing protein (putative c-di-GMP-specific phosphodiesterase class I)